MSTYLWTVGVDWGGDQHHLMVLDAMGVVHGTRKVAHTAPAIAEAVQWLQQITGSHPEAIAIAIETPRGVLVASLIEHDFAGFSINPKQVDRFRDRFSVGLTLSPSADDAWLWDVLQAEPHPDRWPQLSRRTITATLRAHRIRRTTTEDVMAAVQRPRLRAAAGVAEAVAMRVASLVPQLQLIREQRQQTERRIERALEELADASDDQPREHRDVHILRSLPGVGRTVTATMLTEAAGPLADRDYALRRAHAGTAPVTKRSSKRTFHVQMRYACKHRLRQALYHWARTSIQYDAPARAYYDALRSRGHHHARALRSVADRWLRILIAMLNTGTLYDPSRFVLKST